MKIVSRRVMRDMDYEAIHEYGISGIILMEHAAICIFDYMKEHIQKDKHILILCGPGNNGGDGFALARLLVQEGYEHVTLLCNVPYRKMSHDEAIYARIAQSYHIPIIQTEDMDILQPLLEKQDCIVDALFGTGLKRNIEGFYDELILRINRLHTYVISIDIPSGIHGDTGEIMNCAIQANVTITFECMKLGQVVYPGSSYCGEVIVKSIGIPREIIMKIPEYIQILSKDIIKAFLPLRVPHSHKGNYGKVLMVGGSSSMHGAITLCAKAALYSGVGTLTLMIPESIRTIIANKLEECMILSILDDKGFFHKDAVHVLKEQLANYDIIVLGNGMGRNGVTRDMVEVVLKSNKPCILDADALYEVGNCKELLKLRDALTILTPHPKEMSYISGKSIKEIMINPLQFAREFTSIHPSVVLVLKDQHTIICNQKHMYMNIIGNHALAKGGSGDVLCGILSGLFAQSKDGLASACSAVYVHAFAADELIKEKNAYSILPSDLIGILTDVYNEVMDTNTEA